MIWQKSLPIFRGKSLGRFCYFHEGGPDPRDLENTDKQNEKPETAESAENIAAKHAQAGERMNEISQNEQADQKAEAPEMDSLLAEIEDLPTNPEAEDSDPDNTVAINNETPAPQAKISPTALQKQITQIAEALGQSSSTMQAQMEYYRATAA